MLRARAFSVGIPAWILLGTVACYPGDGSTLEELDLVATAYDQSMVFTENQTYVVVDPVVQLGGDGTTISREFDALILSEVRANLNALGYTEEAAPDINPPNMVVVVSVTAENRVAVSQSYTYFAYDYPYWSCCGPGWGAYYPPLTTVTRYRTGSLFIEIRDPDRRNEATQELATVWAAAINGILGDSSTSRRIRLVRNIAQAFDQSPYLRVP